MNYQQHSAHITLVDVLISLTYTDMHPDPLFRQDRAAAAYSNDYLPDGGNYIGSVINAEFKSYLRVFLTYGLSWCIRCDL
jgi:hypothetical protein